MHEAFLPSLSAAGIQVLNHLDNLLICAPNEKQDLSLVHLDLLFPQTIGALVQRCVFFYAWYPDSNGTHAAREKEALAT